VAPYRKLKREQEGEGGIPFDPLLVAKKGEGWEGVLEGVLREWVGRAADEVVVKEETERGLEGGVEGKGRGGWL
jgi:hypothetical protein